MFIPEPLKDYAAQLGFPESPTLARIFTLLYDGPDDLALVAALPGTAEEVAAKTGLPGDRARKRLMEMVKQGVIIVDFKNFSRFRRFPAMIELRDSSVAGPDTSEELLKLWERLVLVESGPMIQGLKGREIAPMVRVVPIERTVEARNTVLDVDSARRIFQEADIITAMPCVCRKIARANGRGGDCPAPKEAVCLQTGLFAAGVAARGLGEKLSREEALRRVGIAEEAGLVHMVRNNVQKDMFMCNCCSCCCTGLHFVLNYNYPGAVAPSRFSIRLDPDLCSSCGVCVDRCQFKAITMNGGLPEIALDRCMGCGNCALTCPEEALSLVETRPREHIRVK